MSAPTLLQIGSHIIEIAAQDLSAAVAQAHIGDAHRAAERIDQAIEKLESARRLIA